MACVTQRWRFETNLNISRIQAKRDGLKGQRTSLEAAIKDTQAKVAELEVTLRATKQDMAQ